MCVPRYAAAISVLSVLVQRVCSSSMLDSFDLKDVPAHIYVGTCRYMDTNIVSNTSKCTCTHTHTRTYAFMFVCPKIISLL